jgi:hypothetical protein
MRDISEACRTFMERFGGNQGREAQIPDLNPLNEARGRRQEVSRFQPTGKGYPEHPGKIIQNYARMRKETFL